jgi:hypothetical protein
LYAASKGQTCAMAARTVAVAHLHFVGTTEIHACAHPYLLGQQHIETKCKVVDKLVGAVSKSKIEEKFQALL